jgi:hypothetical protein
MMSCLTCPSLCKTRHVCTTCIIITHYGGKLVYKTLGCLQLGLHASHHPSNFNKLYRTKKLDVRDDDDDHDYDDEERQRRSGSTQLLLFYKSSGFWYN